MHPTMRSQGGVHDHDSVSDPPAGDACILILGCMNADADACVRGRFRILVLEKVHKIGFRILEKVQKNWVFLPSPFAYVHFGRNCSRRSECWEGRPLKIVYSSANCTC
jgi:hypothetical protein